MNLNQTATLFADSYLVVKCRVLGLDYLLRRFRPGHALNPGATAATTTKIALAGIFLALPFLLTGKLALSIGVHIAWNFFQGNVFGFPVSGNSMFRTTIFNTVQGGPELWTGGTFGPEAGLLGLIAIVVGSLAMMWWVNALAVLSFSRFPRRIPAASHKLTSRVH